MLLVEDSMTREVVTASPRATAYASINVAGVPGLLLRLTVRVRSQGQLASSGSAA